MRKEIKPIELDFIMALVWSRLTYSDSGQSSALKDNTAIKEKLKREYYMRIYSEKNIGNNKYRRT